MKLDFDWRTPDGFKHFLSRQGVEQIDAAFLHRLDTEVPDLATALRQYRSASAPPPPLEYSAFLLALAPHIEAHIVELFDISDAVADTSEKTLAQNIVMDFKKQFVMRRARRYRGKFDQGFAEIDAWLEREIDCPDGDKELAIARFGLKLLEQPDAHGDAIERLTQWCALCLTQEEAKRAIRGWASFVLPDRLDFEALVPVVHLENDAARRMVAPPERLRRRDGFALTDRRMDARHVQSNVYYCIYCHDHDGDFCSKGFPEEKGNPAAGLKLNPLNVVLTGCPLDEKISEMHVMKREGRTIAALAMAMLDNPMVPATGHRICNDCMKGCIYQKQDPVDIPQIETRVLVDVLNLPWGVEIYDLLTRWNPLRQQQFAPKPYNGKKVLIAGQGPAGFTLAHHLTMEGCAVVGIDGLKIEPLAEPLLNEPVRDYATLEEPLDRRVTRGLGGVAEYGITVRWDKNFLTLISLTLARRAFFQVFGGVRLGGTITLESAWQLGFHHVAIAMGTGIPHVLSIDNSLARGMRQASDFLMALQLTGAAKEASLANLQVRLPAVVIGGGLTGIDTATEVQAYYVAQVEKILARYEALAHGVGEARIRAQLNEEDTGILDEFLEHGLAVRAERERAAEAHEAPDFVPLLRAWGGVTVAFRRAMNESSAYIRNHEEIVKAMEEGIFYAEGLEPVRVEVDRFEHVERLICRHRLKSENGQWLTQSDEVTLPARAIFVAAGAAPNTVYEREYAGTFQLSGSHFAMHKDTVDGLQPIELAAHCKSAEFGPFTSYQKEDKRVSFLGDTHPVFHGSVVKAIASAKRSYPDIMRSLGPITFGEDAAYQTFRAMLDEALAPRVLEIRRDSPSVLELLVKAPLAAEASQPGQFFRLQTFETRSPQVGASRLQTEPLALSGVHLETGALRFMVIEAGASSRLCGLLKPGDPLVLMGPTGRPTVLPRDQTVMVAGGRRGAAVMLTLGPALRAQGNRVLYFAGFRTAHEIYHQSELEAAADQIIWCTASGAPITPRRPQDRSVTGDYIAIVEHYATGALERRPSDLPLQAVDRVIAIGTAHLLELVQHALKDQLAGFFRPEVQAIGSVGSPMQCMLQGVCAQCLQWQIDPDTGNRTRAVFSCAMQDQPLHWIDTDNLAARLAQNRLQERLTDLWLDYLLTRADVPRV